MLWLFAANKVVYKSQLAGGGHIVAASRTAYDFFPALIMKLPSHI